MRKKTKLLKFDAQKYDDLRPWQKRAFDLLYKKELTGDTVKSVAEQIGKSRVAVSQFYNSKAYAEIATAFTRSQVRGMESLAIDATRDILTDIRVNVQSARARVAMKILDDATAPDPSMAPKEGDVNNILQIFFGNIKDFGDLTFDKVRKAKESLLKRIEGEVEHTAEAGS